MLINGMLYNSEAWHAITNDDITALQKVDEMLLRFLLNSQSKAPLEVLYLESGALPVRHIISSRRMNYFQTVIKRDEEELTRRILEAQINDPTDGDFIQLVKNDFQMAGINFDINEIRNTGIDIFQKKVKAKMRDVALTYLKNLQQTHSKIKDIKYEKLKIQDYLKSPLFSNSETSLLYSLRSRTAETFKANYRNMYGNIVSCPLKCPQEDTQYHLL